MPAFDITILTESRYVNPGHRSPYIKNVLKEDQLVRSALEDRGLKVHRTNWDDPRMNWSETSYVLFRSTWDYFNRFPEFDPWLQQVSRVTFMINPYSLIRWNLDKHYLAELADQGIHIPPTRFLRKGDHRSLQDVVEESGWKEIILKPVVSGGSRHTYRFSRRDCRDYESIYRSLLKEESLIIQEFQEQVLTRGEVAFMLFAGKYTHAVLKKAKKGDFRVQDDFGGTVHSYDPAPEEIAWAEQVVSLCHPLPVYARVDAIWDNHQKPALAELELIEPELWFRFHPQAAGDLAEAILKHLA
jgi:glutathione synthase/RimK-type ligase-like ATP-grasp enzyme